MKYIVMGDWGGLPVFPYRTAIEEAVAREMGKIADKLDARFVLALGDNFYFDGVKDVDDPRFQVGQNTLILLVSKGPRYTCASYLIAIVQLWDYSHVNPQNPGSRFSDFQGLSIIYIYTSCGPVKITGLGC